MAPARILNRHLTVHEVHLVEGHFLLTEHGLRHGRANAVRAHQHVILPGVPACPGEGCDRARREIHGFHCRAVQPPYAGPGVHRFLEQLLQDHTRNGENAPPVFIVGMKAATGPILPAPHPQPPSDDRLLQAAASQRMATALAKHQLERTGRRHTALMALKHRDGFEMGLQQQRGHEANRTATRDEEVLAVHGVTVWRVDTHSPDRSGRTCRAKSRIRRVTTSRSRALKSNQVINRSSGWKRACNWAATVAGQP